MIGSVSRRSQPLNRFGRVNEDLGGQFFKHEQQYQAERLNLDDDDLWIRS